MLLNLLPELLTPILALLNGEDLKSVSLCNKHCYQLAVPMLWENVTVNKGVLFTPIPSQMVFCRKLIVMIDAEDEDAEEEEEIVKKLVKLMESSNPTTLHFSSMQCGTETSLLSSCLAAISKMTNLTRLRLQIPDFSPNASLDHVWKNLGHITGLEDLNLSYCGSLSDKNLQHIGLLTGLKTLNLHCDNVTDAGLQHIGYLSGLKNLDISNNMKISDAGLKHIMSLSQLQELNIEGTSVTDAGLEVIGSLKELHVLDLGVCYRITASGIHKLIRHSPNLKISYLLFR